MAAQRGAPTTICSGSSARSANHNPHAMQVMAAHRGAHVHKHNLQVVSKHGDPLNDSSDRHNAGGCRVMANFIASAPFFTMGNRARGESAPAQRGVSHHSCTCTHAQCQVCIYAEHATRLDSQGTKPWHVWIEHDREWHARQQFHAATAHHRHSDSPSSLLAHHGGGSSRPEDKGEKG